MGLGCTLENAKTIFFACRIRISAFTEAPGLHMVVCVEIARWLAAAGGLQRTAHHSLLKMAASCVNLARQTEDSMKVENYLKLPAPSIINSLSTLLNHTEWDRDP